MYQNNNFNNYNYTYNYNKNSFSDNNKKNNNKKKRRKEDNNGGGFGFALLFFLIIIVIGAVFFTCTEKGQTIFGTIKQKIPMLNKEDSLYEENWDYGKNGSEEAFSNFNMNDAQNELASQDGYVIPTVNPNKNPIKIPNAKDGELITIVEMPEYDDDNRDIPTVTKKPTQIITPTPTPTAKPTKKPNKQNSSGGQASIIGQNENGQDTMTTYNGNELPYYHGDNQKPENTPIPTQKPIVQEQLVTQTQTQQPTQVPQSGTTYEYDNDLKNQSPTQYYLFENTINDILIEINNTRKEAGANEVSLDMTLCEMCAYRSLDMVKRGYYSHYYEDISQLKVVMYAWGRTGMHLENLAKVKTDNVPAAVIKGWKQSSGHYDAMTNVDVTKVGIAVVKSGEYYYVTTIYS